MLPKKIHFGILLSIIFVNLINAQQDDFPVLKGLYLGQKPPGYSPEIFAPGIIATNHHDRYASFSPDGKELFFQRRGRQFTTLIMHMNQVNGVWQKPQAALFSGNPEFCDAGPILSPDGNILVFYSRRPKSGNFEPETNFDIWITCKQNGVWGNPENAGQSINTAYNEEDATIAADGTIYFSSNRPTVKDAKGNYDIFYSKFVDGKYAQSELLQDSINTEHFEGHTFVAPDESYIMYTSSRSGGFGDADIWISYKKQNGTWTHGINMGDKINTSGHDVAPVVSPDGKYIFFNKNGNIYWVDARIIEDLKPEGLK